MFWALQVFLRYAATLVIIRDSVHQKIFGRETLQVQSYDRQDKYWWCCHIDTTELYFRIYICKCEHIKGLFKNCLILKASPISLKCLKALQTSQSFLMVKFQRYFGNLSDEVKLVCKFDSRPVIGPWEPQLLILANHRLATKFAY